MGLYDRGYYHEEEDYDRPQPTGGGVTDTVVGKIILLTVALWIVDALSAENPVLQPWLCLKSDLLLNPLDYYRLLTAGFVHNPVYPSHIVFTMLGLFVFGASVERRRGSGEFLRFYLVATFLSNLIWSCAALIAGWQGMVSFGAGGAVAAVAVALAVMDPNRTILLMFVIPTPLWLAVTLYVVIDVSGSMRGEIGPMSQVAGAAFGYLYATGGWSLTRSLPTPDWMYRLGDRFSSWNTRRRARGRDLKVYSPVDAEEDDAETALEAEVDRILRKINRDGEASLTKTERATLEKASRRYRNR